MKLQENYNTMSMEKKQTDNSRWLHKVFRLEQEKNNWMCGAC